MSVHLADFEDYGFQGCWKEDPFNPDLPILVPTNSSTKPSDCLRVCGQEHTFLSVKTVSDLFFTVPISELKKSKQSFYIKL